MLESNVLFNRVNYLVFRNGNTEVRRAMGRQLTIHAGIAFGSPLKITTSWVS